MFYRWEVSHRSCPRVTQRHGHQEAGYHCGPPWCLSITLSKRPSITQQLVIQFSGKGAQTLKHLCSSLMVVAFRVSAHVQAHTHLHSCCHATEHMAHCKCSRWLVVACSPAKCLGEAVVGRSPGEAVWGQSWRVNLPYSGRLMLRNGHRVNTSWTLRTEFGSPRALNPCLLLPLFLKRSL